MDTAPPGARSPASSPAGPATGFTAAPPSFYDVIHRRRDVRAEFTGAPVDAAALTRILDAAHSAPSVGLSQPWDFVLVTDDATRRAFWTHVQDERRTFADSLEGERAERFAGIKIDGILEASLSLVVTYDPARGAPDVLGRHAIADAGLYSVCLAIENMWLACTAEGWGMGWVSFYRESFVRDLLGIPEGIRPVAWLCLGPVGGLQDTPDLERHGWRTRVPLDAVVHHERWEDTGEDDGVAAVEPQPAVGVAGGAHGD
jgi:5,6-dimethylbenzimidazole synthase